MQSFCTNVCYTVRCDKVSLIIVRIEMSWHMAHIKCLSIVLGAA